MAKRIVCCSQCGKPARDWDRDCRFCGEALPEITVTKCATCAGVLSTGDTTCGHCGAAPAHFRDPTAALVRCDRCAKPVCTTAALCPRCRIPPPLASRSLEELETPRRHREPASAARAAPIASDDLIATVVAGKAVPSVNLAARAHLAEESAPRPTAASVPTPRQPAAEGPATAACPVCRRPLPQSAEVCDSCGLRLVVRQSAVPQAHPQPSVWLRYGAVAVALLGFLGVGWVVQSQQEEAEREEALRLAVADAPSAHAVADLKRRAADLGVQPQVLVRVKRLCFLTPDRVPSDKELAAAVDGRAEAAERGRTMERHVAERCRR